MGKMFNRCFLSFNWLALKIHIPGKAATKSIHPHTPAADAFITKGTAKLVIDLLNNEQIDEISKLSKDDFKNLGILELLTAQRQSGLSNLIDTLISIAKKNLA